MVDHAGTRLGYADERDAREDDVGGERGDERDLDVDPVLDEEDGGMADGDGGRDELEDRGGDVWGVFGCEDDEIVAFSGERDIGDGTQD